MEKVESSSVGVWRDISDSRSVLSGCIGCWRLWAWGPLRLLAAAIPMAAAGQGAMGQNRAEQRSAAQRSPLYRTSRSRAILGRRDELESEIDDCLGGARRNHQELLASKLNESGMRGRQGGWLMMREWVRRGEQAGEKERGGRLGSTGRTVVR